MGTFVEFYTTLLGFVNFRLYTSIGLIYPPRFDAKSDEQGGELGAITLEGRGIEGPKENGPVNGHVNRDLDGEMEPTKPNEEIQKQIAAIKEGLSVEQDVPQSQGHGQASDLEVDDVIDTFETTGEDADILPQPQARSNEAGSLFAPFTFFLSRETPRQPLEFILRAFGCKRIGWDAILGDGAFTNNEADPTITHHIVDRPLTTSLAGELQVSQDPSDSSSTTVVRSGQRVPGRTLVQPQWVWDCINEVKLLRPDLYAPGATLPPHLSPWVKPTKGAYDPSAPLAEQEREGEAEEAEGLSDEEDEQAQGKEDEEPDGATEDGIPLPSPKPLSSTADLQDDHGMTIAGSDSDSDSSPASSADSFAGFASDPDSDPDPTLTQHQRELEAEAAGLTFSDTLTKKANGQPLKGILKGGDEARRKAAKRRRREEEEELERRKMMMGRKKRKVVEKMLYSNRQKEGEAEALRAKRRKIEAGKAKG